MKEIEWLVHNHRHKSGGGGRGSPILLWIGMLSGKESGKQESKYLSSLDSVIIRLVQHVNAHLLSLYVSHCEHIHKAWVIYPCLLHSFIALCHSYICTSFALWSFFYSCAIIVCIFTSIFNVVKRFEVYFDVKRYINTVYYY